MARVPKRDTAPELAVRRAAHALGLRADLVFPRLRIAVFVDGCFWHGCPCHGNRPRHNGDWWREKIERNRRRDQDTDRRLAETGWTVVRAWEHDDPAAVAATIAAEVIRARSAPSRLSLKA
jgi:DNA mismatch endonuclease (patch repair protein)